MSGSPAQLAWLLLPATPLAHLATRCAPKLFALISLRFCKRQLQKLDSFGPILCQPLFIYLTFYGSGLFKFLATVATAPSPSPPPLAAACSLGCRSCLLLQWLKELLGNRPRGQQIVKFSACLFLWTQIYEIITFFICTWSGCLGPSQAWHWGWACTVICFLASWRTAGCFIRILVVVVRSVIIFVAFVFDGVFSPALAFNLLLFMFWVPAWEIIANVLLALPASTALLTFYLLFIRLTTLMGRFFI